VSSAKLSTRDRILDKTWHLMERRHGRLVPLSEIARLAGVSRQAVYLHFGSRLKLLVATVRHVDEVKHLRQRLQATYEAATGSQALDAYIDFWADYIPEIYGLASALMSVRDSDPAAAAAWNDRMQEQRRGCRALIDCLLRDRSLAEKWSADKAADALWAMTSIDVWESLTRACGWSGSEYASWLKFAARRTLIRG
jgi:AcrR family transcriptional regulator